MTIRLQPQKLLPGSSCNHHIFQQDRGAALADSPPNGN